MLRLVIQSQHIDPQLETVIETFAPIRVFVHKLAQFLTHAFPANSPGYSCLLAEVLDFAMVAYYRLDAKETREQVAGFLANAVSATTDGLLTYKVSQLRDQGSLPWHAWEDGALAGWLTWGGSVLTFTPIQAPTSEERYVINCMLQMRLLTYKDVVGMAKAGIDMKSKYLF